jgi:hypothetical protein
MLEDLLGVHRTEFSIAERWASRPPVEGKGKSIQEFLDKVVLSGAQYIITFSFSIDRMLPLLLRWL